MDLDDATSESIHKIDGNIITRKANCGDDRHLKAEVVRQISSNTRGLAVRYIEYVTKDSRLEEAVAVESNVKEKPTTSGTNQLFQVSGVLDSLK